MRGFTKRRGETGENREKDEVFSSEKKKKRKGLKSRGGSGKHPGGVTMKGALLPHMRGGSEEHEDKIEEGRFVI